MMQRGGWGWTSDCSINKFAQTEGQYLLKRKLGSGASTAKAYSSGFGSAAELPKCFACSWLGRYRYLERAPAAEVKKLCAIRTADPQPFMMPSVGELSETREREDEEKERGYRNDPGG